MWRTLVEYIWDRLCWMTRGWAGGHGLPDLFWRIPLGKPRKYFDDDPEPIYENSIAALLFDLEHAVYRISDPDQFAVCKIPLTTAEAWMISPDFVNTMLGLEGREESEAEAESE